MIYLRPPFTLNVFLADPLSLPGVSLQLHDWLKNFPVLPDWANRLLCKYINFCFGQPPYSAENGWVSRGRVFHQQDHPHSSFLWTWCLGIYSGFTFSFPVALNESNKLGDQKKPYRPILTWCWNIYTVHSQQSQGSLSAKTILKLRSKVEKNILHVKLGRIGVLMLMLMLVLGHFRFGQCSAHHFLKSMQNFEIQDNSFSKKPAMSLSIWREHDNQISLDWGPSYSEKKMENLESTITTTKMRI